MGASYVPSAMMAEYKQASVVAEVRYDEFGRAVRQEAIFGSVPALEDREGQRAERLIAARSKRSAARTAGVRVEGRNSDGYNDEDEQYDRPGPTRGGLGFAPSTTSESLDDMVNDDELSDLELSPTEQSIYHTKLSSIKQAGRLVLEDVRPEISSIKEILRQFSSFRKSMTDQYRDAYVDLSLPGLMEPLVLLDIVTHDILGEDSGTGRIILADRHWHEPLKQFSIEAMQSRKDAKKTLKSSSNTTTGTAAADNDDDDNVLLLPEVSGRVSASLSLKCLYKIVSLCSYC
jgi:hypothetical protein